MLGKPNKCVGCPFYGDGRGFVPGDVKGRKVLLMGQTPDEEEESTGIPASGKMAKMLEKSFLPLAGLTRDDVDVDSILRCRWKGYELPPLNSKVVKQAIAHCTEAYGPKIDMSKTRLIVAQGAYSLYGLTGETSISTWRGWLLPYLTTHWSQNVSGIYTPTAQDTPVLATLHLASLYAEPAMQDPTKKDWGKVARILAGKWPESLTFIKTNPPFELPVFFAYDTEFVVESGNLIREQFGWRDADDTPHLHVVEARDHASYFTSEKPTVILQNAPADLPYLDRLLPGGYALEDTLLAHARLWSDLPHDLDFLGSIYARTNRWKHLVRSNPIVYAGADGLGTWDIWKTIVQELQGDPLTYAVYRKSIECWPIIHKAHTIGLKVDQAKAKEALKQLEYKCKQAELEAQAAVGWPIKLSSPAQVAFQIYTIEKAKKGKVWG